ncbi:MAG: AI-2E family transporter YdiK [Burkholderiales bacterium]|nr:AI-2E family transporter YdiK [Burkholderiales bacterium]
MKTPPLTADLTRTTLAVLFIGGLLIGSFFIVQPFLPAIIWSAMLAIATWPLLLGLQRRLWNRRWLAGLVLLFALLIMFMLPFAMAVSTVIEHSGDIAETSRKILSFRIGEPPEWLGRIPLVGSRLVSLWNDVVSAGASQLTDQVMPHMGNVATWLAAQASGLGSLLIQVSLALIITAIFYAKGEVAFTGLLSFAKRLGGDRGVTTIDVAARAVRGVALGVVVTAIVQAVIAGIGLWICGVPFAGLLAAVSFLLSVAQVGPGPVLVPAVVWLYWNDHIWLGSLLAVIALVSLNIDNFLRPFLIQRGGANLPLLLIFVGVIGGMMAFGLVGLFVGPVILAVAYELLVAWIHETPDRS